MSEPSVNQPSGEDPLAQVERQVNRLASQMSNLAQMQKTSYKSFAEVTTIENRRFALLEAMKFLRDTGPTPAYMNSAAVIGVADMWAKWLDDGTQPDMAAAAADTAAYAWAVAHGLFPESVVAAAKAAVEKGQAQS